MNALMKNDKIHTVLHRHPNVIRAKSIGMEFRYDYDLSGLSIPVLHPVLHYDVFSPIKCLWEYDFYDYTKLPDCNLFRIIESGGTNVGVSSVWIIPYDKMTVPKLPAFIDKQFDCLSKAIIKFEQEQVKQMIDKLEV